MARERGGEALNALHAREGGVGIGPGLKGDEARVRARGGGCRPTEHSLAVARTFALARTALVRSSLGADRDARRCLGRDGSGLVGPYEW